MDGILIVDKSAGMTSHDVVDLVRRRFHLKKVGHAGTLDPMATGVLILLIGSMTKASAELMAGEKEYEATLTLGARSDTGDAEGSLVPSGAMPAHGRSEIEAAFARFNGEIDQLPPMYSAVKHKGQKLYELARKGQAVALEPRKVTIRHLEVTAIALPNVSFRLVCSKGTYVRQLAVDIGETLGCGAYLSRLVRTRSGAFTLAHAVTVDALRRMNTMELQTRFIAV